MKTNFRRPMLAALLVAAVTAVGVVALEPLYSHDAVARAAQARGRQDSATTARRQVGAPINDALKLVESKDWAGAKAKVEEADAVKDKTPYEEYMVAKYLTFIAINGEPQDLAAATVAVNREVASGGAPEMEQEVMYSTALRLNYNAKDYSKAIQNAADLQMIGGTLDDTASEILVQSYYNTMDYMNAVKTAKAVSDAKEAAGQPPPAAILGLLLNSQAKLMDDAGYRVTLDKLATVSAQPEVWGQVMDFALSEITKGGAQQTEHHLLNLYRLAMMVGTMRDVDYAAMATIDLTNGLPNEAKDALTKGNRTGDLMNQANTMLANDQGSLTGLAEEAGKQSNGEIDVKLGESYMTYGRHDEAVTALRAGIQKGGLMDLPDAQTTLGIALYKAGKKDEAMEEFRKAETATTPAGTVAHSWTLFLQRPSA